MLMACYLSACAYIDGLLAVLGVLIFFGYAICRRDHMHHQLVSLEHVNLLKL